MTGSFTAIKAKNFRGFRECEFSFAKTSSKNKPLIVAYGQNGSGKSSMASLFLTLRTLTTMVDSRFTIAQAFSQLEVQKGDAFDVKEILKKSFTTEMADLIADNKNINSRGENMEIEYVFIFDERPGFYRIVTNDEGCIDEELSFRFETKRETIFKADQNGLTLNTKTFVGAALHRSLQEEYGRLFGQSPFLGILYHHFISSNEDYRKKSFHNCVGDLLAFFGNIAVSVAGSSALTLPTSERGGVVFNLEGAPVNENNELRRPAIETGLTAFFSSLSFKVSSVEYKRLHSAKGEIYGLYFNEKHGDQEVRSIPLRLLSSGTKKLISLFFSLYNALLGSVTVIDEVDNGIHDLIVANVLSATKDEEMGQLIFTTHNTLLMKKLPKDAIYFFDEDGNGNSIFYSLDEFGRQVQSGTDVVGRYLNGLYGGTPFPEAPSMHLIKEMMDEKYQATLKERSKDV